MPDRPESVPAEAWWSRPDNEWILGPKDAEGRLHGLVRYWRPDGTRCCESELVAGQFHGPTTRYHEVLGKRNDCRTTQRTTRFAQPPLRRVWSGDS